jgi:hypothetical protein
MTGGDELSARERGSAGAAGLAGWAVRVAGPHGRERARTRTRARGWAIRLGRAREREGGVGPR